MPDDHIAGDHIHTNKATCNIDEPQQKNHMRTVSDRILCVCVWEGGGLKHVLLDPNPRRLLLQLFETFKHLIRKFPNPQETSMSRI